MLNLNDLKPNLVIDFNGQIYQIIAREFIKNARGKPVLSAKLKNLITKKVVHHTFQQSDAVKEAAIEKITAQFLYQDQGLFYFMDNSTYEQFSLPKDIIGSCLKFLKDDMEITLEKYQDDIIGISLPVKMDFKVISAPPNTKGNSAQSNDKEVEIETGCKIRVPMFIKEGDTIRINTEKEEYVERV